MGRDRGGEKERAEGEVGRDRGGERERAEGEVGCVTICIAVCICFGLF